MPVAQRSLRVGPPRRFRSTGAGPSLLLIKSRSRSNTSLWLFGSVKQVLARLVEKKMVVPVIDAYSDESRASASNAELIVEDNGIGGLEDGKNGKQRGLGQRIIAGMADKLNGSFHYEPMHRGTRAIMTFPAGDDIQVLSAKQGNAA